MRGEGLLSFCNGWRVTVFGATGGTGKTSDKCSFAKVVEMERVDATGGASPSPTKSGWDSADVKAYKCIQMIALRKARGIVRFWKVMRGEGVCDNNIKSGHSIPP